MTQRYYIGKGEHAVGEIVELVPDEAHHLRRVMRAREGEHVKVFACGREFEAVVSCLRPRVRLILLREVEPVPPPQLRLHQAIPWLRGGRTDELVQELTQLGVETIVVYRARRCVGLGDESKVARLQRLAIETCKQCERADVPEILCAESTGSAIEMLRERAAEVVVLGERVAQPRLSQVVREILARSSAEGDPRPTLGIISGPEGGFEENEWAIANVRVASLGERIFRADFAPIAGAIVALAGAGDL